MSKPWGEVVLRTPDGAWHWDRFFQQVLYIPKGKAATAEAKRRSA